MKPRLSYLPFPTLPTYLTYLTYPTSLEVDLRA